MFTFGRSHEKKCAIQYIRDTTQIELLERVVDVVHDLIEGKCSVSDAGVTLSDAFSQGGSGVWEQSSSWMIKLADHYPEILSNWHQLVSHRKAIVRFRVACCLDEMPSEIAKELGAILANDLSKKVRSMSVSRLEEINKK